MSKINIAEILHYAADNCLAATRKKYWADSSVGKKEKFSCCAVEEAYVKLHGSNNFDKDIRRIQTGLEKMGCPVESSHAFNDCGEFNEENQQARYAWLKFAAMMAEEQGV